MKFVSKQYKAGVRRCLVIEAILFETTGGDCLISLSRLSYSRMGFPLMYVLKFRMFVQHRIIDDDFYVIRSLVIP